MKRDLTRGGVTLPLMRLAFPIILASSLTAIYNATDAFWLGQLGSSALAAMALGTPVLMLASNLILGIPLAGSTLASQFKGARNARGVNKTAKQTLLAAALISFCFAAFGVLASPAIISFLGAPESVFADASAYLAICFAGLFLGTLFTTSQSVLNGIGETRTPLYVVLASVLLNFLLDPLFINGFGAIPAFGVAGAAWATFCTQALTGVVGVLVLASGWKGVSFRLWPLGFDFSFFKRLARLGLPSSLDKSAYPLSHIVEVSVVSWFGVAALAAYGVAKQVLRFFFIPSKGLAVATGVAVGQNLGAEKKRRAVKVAERGATLTFLLMFALLVGVMLFGKDLARFFVPGEEAVISAAFLFIVIHALSFPLNGVRMAIVSVARASGNVIHALYLSIATIALRVVGTFAFAYFLGFYGVAVMWPVVALLMLFAAYYWFRKYPWWETRVINKDEFAAG